MHAKPTINVTPLIDVLLVLLIIFMVITPLKPTDFKAKIPAEPKPSNPADPHINTLVVTLRSDSKLLLNNEGGYGNVQNSEDLVKRLSDIFRQRTENGVMSQTLFARNDLTYDQKVEKTVFIKAPRSINYGSVAKVIDAVKISGADPISLQIDDLE